MMPISTLSLKGGDNLKIIYNPSTKLVTNVMGIRNPVRPLTEEELPGFYLVGGLPTGYREEILQDVDTMASIWASVEAGALVEVELDGNGDYIGVKAYTPITASAEPNPVIVNAVTTITANTPDDTEIVFVVDEVEYTRPAVDGVATLEITCDTAGELVIVAKSPTKYGQASLTLEVMASV